MTVEHAQDSQTQTTGQTGVGIKRTNSPAILSAPAWLKELMLVGYILTLAFAAGIVVYGFGAAVHKEMTSKPHQCAMATAPGESRLQA